MNVLIRVMRRVSCGSTDTPRCDTVLLDECAGFLAVVEFFTGTFITKYFLYATALPGPVQSPRMVTFLPFSTALLLPTLQPELRLLQVVFLVPHRFYMFPISRIYQIFCREHDGSQLYFFTLNTLVCRDPESFRFVDYLLCHAFLPTH